MEKVTAIVLAAGAGKRMHSAVRKQYMLLCGKPVLYYSLRAFQDCPFVDEIVLVIGQDEIAYCQEPVSYTHLDVYKRQVIVYATPKMAFFFPKECIGDDYEEITKFITGKMEPGRAKFAK